MKLKNYSFSNSSRSKLETCHPDLQRIFNKVIKYYDCTILQGQRGEKEQNDFFERGLSKLQYPNSKHNKQPSMAVDVSPYPIIWENKIRFYYFAGIVQGIATSMGIKIRWGGDWNQNNNLHNQSFFDLPHYEIC